MAASPASITASAASAQAVEVNFLGAPAKFIADEEELPDFGEPIKGESSDTAGHFKMASYSLIQSDEVDSDEELADAEKMTPREEVIRHKINISSQRIVHALSGTLDEFAASQQQQHSPVQQQQQAPMPVINITNNDLLN